MVYTVAWDETTPVGTEAKSLGDNRIREVKAQLRERLATEHTDITGTTGDASLMHEWATVSKSTGSPYTALPADHIILVTTGSSSDYTIDLPTAVGITGKPYKIKKIDSGTKTVIIDANGTQTIDGALTHVLIAQYDFVDIISDGANWQVVVKTPSTNIGDIIMTGRSTAPGGWLLCDGTAVSRTTYANLFAAISTSFGVGDSSTTFNLPDLRQRFPIGKAASGTGSTLGGTGGLIDHTHTVTTSIISSNLVGAANNLALHGTYTSSTNNPPFQAVNFIIKY